MPPRVISCKERQILAPLVALGDGFFGRSEIDIINFLIMIQIREKSLRLIDPHSISFRLYLIIVPTTILVILLISYVDSRVAAQLLDKEIQNRTAMVATQLAGDLAGLNPRTSPDTVRIWLRQIAETNFCIARIEVFRLSGDTLMRTVNAPMKMTGSGFAAPACQDKITRSSQVQACFIRQSPFEILHSFGIV